MDCSVADVRRFWLSASQQADPRCPHCGSRHLFEHFAFSDVWFITYCEMNFGLCPTCKGLVVFDFRQGVATKPEDSRRPFPFFIGIGRLILLVVAAALAVPLMQGTLTTIPLLFWGTILLEAALELLLKRVVPGWAYQEASFELVTDRITQLNILLTLFRAVLVGLAIFRLW